MMANVPGSADCGPGDIVLSPPNNTFRELKLVRQASHDLAKTAVHKRTLVLSSPISSTSQRGVGRARQTAAMTQ